MDRFHKNPFLDKEATFNPHVDVGTDGSGSFQAQLKSALQHQLDQLTKQILKHPASDDYSVYTGSSGIYFTYWSIAQAQNAQIQPQIMTLMNQFVENVVKGRGLKGRRFTFLCGDAGPIVVAYLISNDPAQRSILLQKLMNLQELVFKDTANDGGDTANELLYGRVGYLYALLYMNQQFPQNPPLIPIPLISKVANCVVEDGIRKRQSEGPPLHYEWHDKVYLGAAHGFVGILYMLLKASDYLEPKHIPLVKETLEWVLMQRFPSGNLRFSVGSKEDKLVHFCHGAPGLLLLLLEAAKKYQEARYLSGALDCGEVIWSRGILRKSYSLCHGTCGNALTLLALYEHTQDERWLHRSCLMGAWCFTWGKDATREPDRPNSLFEGLCGSVYFLQDLLQRTYSGGGGGGFPGFHLK